MVKEKKENFIFRALYLMAILFVVDGHDPIEGEILNFSGLFRYYSFHLMLFAFCSGYFYHGEGTFREQLLKNVKRLLVPLYVWNLLYGILAAILRKCFGAALGEPLSLYTLLLAPFTDGQHFAYNFAAWYVGTLFLIKLVYDVLYRTVKGIREKEWILLLVTLVFGAAAVQLCRASDGQPAVPVFVLRVLILLPGFAAGKLYRERLEAHDTIPTAIYLTAIILLRILLSSRYENLAYLVSDCTYFGCDAFGVYAGAVLAIAFYLRVARLLAPLVSKCRPALFISRHTFDIMMHHLLGFWLTDFVFLLFNKFGIGAAGLSVNSMRTVAAYVYAPEGHPEWAVLYLLTGVLFSCAVAFLTDRVRNRLGTQR